MKSTSLFAMILFVVCVAGCSDDKPKISIPGTPLTPQQIIEIRNEDAKVTQEESYGTSQYVAADSIEAENQPSPFGEGE